MLRRVTFITKSNQKFWGASNRYLVDCNLDRLALTRTQHPKPLGAFKT